PVTFMVPLTTIPNVALPVSWAMAVVPLATFRVPPAGTVRVAADLMVRMPATVPMAVTVSDPPVRDRLPLRVRPWMVSVPDEWVTTAPPFRLVMTASSPEAGAWPRSQLVPVAHDPPAGAIQVSVAG